MTTGCAREPQAHPREMRGPRQAVISTASSALSTRSRPGELTSREVRTAPEPTTIPMLARDSSHVPSAHGHKGPQSKNHKRRPGAD